MTAALATYRLQFCPTFRFEDAAELAPYLARLGISHVYASPVWAARPGSTHGYDVVDPNRFNPELGGEQGFHQMAAQLRAHGIGLLLDVVPNHMGVGGDANVFWMDVLRWGPDSPYAAWFDIDWESGFPGLRGKILVPFLGDHYGAALADGALELRFETGDGFSVWAHGVHKLPVDPRGYGLILPELEPTFLSAAPSAWPGLTQVLSELPCQTIERALAAFRGRPGDPASWKRLDSLIACQSWRAAKHTLAEDAINYRRFFTISDLAGIRVEDPEVFEATHRLVPSLLKEGMIDGIRIDHIDGLREPKTYCRRLRQRVQRPFWLLVEKILGADEKLPADWGTDGTTGYEVTNLLGLLLTDPAGRAEITEVYAQFVGRAMDPADVVRTAKREVIEGPMAAEADAITRRLAARARSEPSTSDVAPTAVARALAGYVAELEVYRTYADAAEGLPAREGDRVKRAFAAARAADPRTDPQAFDLVERVVLEGSDEAALRMQQLTGPATAKGLEDRALYRFNRLIALNEVGSEPGRYGISIDGFHDANASRLAEEPGALLTTGTHDTKRGEDARLRIAALAGRSAGWAAEAPRWRRLLPGVEDVDPNDAYFFFQMLVGAWPAEWRPATDVEPAYLPPLRDRLSAALIKSAREAGVHTAWVHGDDDYEGRLSALVAQALDPAGRFLAAFRAFEDRIARDAFQLSLIQSALKLCIPGVPDIYQGCELWDQSLVDPDNRRPVDFAKRSDLLARGQVPADADMPGGSAKLALIHRLLAHRRDHPGLFMEGSYEPILIEGPDREDLVAFQRSHESHRLLLAAWLRPARSPDPETRVPVPACKWRNLLDHDRAVSPEPALLFARLPVAVLVNA